MKKKIAKALVYIGIIIAIVATAGLILTWGSTGTLTFFGLTATYPQWFGAALALGIVTVMLGYVVDAKGAQEAVHRITKAITDPIKELINPVTNSLLPLLLLGGCAVLLFSNSNSGTTIEVRKDNELVEESQEMA